MFRVSESIHGTRDRAGYWQNKPGGRINMFYNHGLTEAVSGFDIKRALTSLDQAGWIDERDHGKRSKKTRIGNETPRLYWIRLYEEVAE